MASLKEEARWILDDARDGIAWLAIWKTGRTWHAEIMYVDYTEGRSYPRKAEEEWKIDSEDAARLREILAEDPEAILVNPVYCNLGPFEDMTLSSLIDGIRFQYSLGGNVSGILRMAGEEE